MQIFKFLFLLGLYFSLLNKANAQIFMPAMRAVISSKPAITTTMYSGGIGNGADIKSIIQSICPPLDVESIFYGGTGYSSSEKNLIQSNCPPLDIESIFYGGTGYSSSEKNLIQSNCPPLEIESIFYGGTGYSSSEKNLIQAVCTPLAVESIYKGGIGYGDAFLFKDNCSFQVISNLIRSYDINNRFSYNGTGTTLGDVSGNGIDGTLVNGVGYNNSNGGSIVFDGSNDYVSFSSGLPSTDDLTYEAWVNPSSFSGFNVILNHDNWSTGYVHFQFDQGALHFDLHCCQVGGQAISSTFNFTTNTWYQVAAVYSKSLGQVSFYVNGTLTNTVNLTGSIPTITNSSLKMGSWNGNDRFFNGKIGLVRIYNSALSASDIQTNFNGSKTRFGL
mgnify:CR=1 FL=1